MEVSVRKTSTDWSIVAVKGRMDAHTSAAVEEQCQTVLDEGAEKMAVDLSEVVYVSSAGLRVMLGVLKQLKARQGKMALLQPQAGVREILDISGFSSIFDIVDSEGYLG